MNQRERITVTTAHFECRMCPTVVTGTTTTGATICVRYRWGRLVVRLDHEPPTKLGGAAGKWIMDKQLDPEALAGCLSYDEIREITAGMIDWPDDITPQSFDNDDQSTWLNL